MWHKASFKLACLAATCAALLAAASLPVASASSGKAALRGTAAPSAARKHFVGSVARSSRVNFDLVLKLRNLRGAEALVKAVSTPGSASYHRYISAGRWEARFSPTAAQVGKARRWLRSQGFKVGAASRDRMTIAASGSAAQVERAFSTGLKRYRLMGHTVRLATRDFTVPAPLAGIVSGAMGINQTVAVTAASGSPSTRAGSGATGINYPPPPPAFIVAKPCGAYYAAKHETLKPPFGHGYPKTVPIVVCGYKPAQFRSAYGIRSTQTGAGARVAIVDAYDSARIRSDATRYFKLNDPGNPFANAHFTHHDLAPFTQQSLCGASGWLTEQAIDVEAVHAMATHARIHYVGAKSCLNTDLYNADDYVVTHHLADVVTNSWSDPAGDVFDSPSDRAAFDHLFIEAAARGIGFQYSSGDDGDNFDLAGISAPGYPSDSPYVTGVGGTTLKINASGKRVGELGWNTGRAFFCSPNAVGVLCTKQQLGHWLPPAADGESGGYTSYNYPLPSYQKGIVPASLSTRNSPVVGPTPMRVIPDISLDADPGTGFLIGLTETFPNGVRYGQTRYGGTSLASPLLAGVIADVDQVAGRSMGFLNPALYALAKNKPTAIEDVLPEKGKQANYRVDHANQIVPGAKGYFRQVRELYYPGPEVYCDGTGNCATRPNTLTVSKGYDALTGLGAPGTNFVQAIGGTGS
jgi:subtilase family serine protease